MPGVAPNPFYTDPRDIGGARGDYYEHGAPEFCPGCGAEADWHYDLEETLASGRDRFFCAHCGDFQDTMAGAKPLQHHPPLISQKAIKRGASPCPPLGTGSVLLPPVWFRPRESRFQFYVGAKPNWHMTRGPRSKLDPLPLPVPAFVSYLQLRKIKALRPAVVRWALDSGGFTMLSTHGRWTIGPETFADDVRRYIAEVGCLDFVPVQDWMCEPQITAQTRKTVADHQRLTVQSYLDLRRLAPEVPWAPVLQGFEIRDYYQILALYQEAGVSLEELQRAPRLGIGSVCRRQSTRQVAYMLREFRDGYGLENMHGFGFKVTGLIYAARFLASADSFAWSKEAYETRAHNRPSSLGHRHGASGGCQNCPDYAVRWRNRLIEKILLAYERLPDDQVDLALEWIEKKIPAAFQDELAFGQQYRLFPE